MKKVVFICFALLMIVRTLPAADEVKLELRRFHVYEHVIKGITDQSDNDWKTLFEQMGVSWPEGSSLFFVPDLCQLAIRNTHENILLLEKIMASSSVMPLMIDIRVDFVEFNLDDLDLLAREGKLCAKELLAIWKSGGARLLCTPHLLTKSGNEGVVKGVTEYIYPTEFIEQNAPSTNATTAAANSVAVIPSAFEMRETGTILQAIPEISVGGTLINMMLNPQIISPPAWRDYGPARPEDGGGATVTPMEAPFFHLQSLSTSVTVANGATLLIGGGMSNRERDKAAYAFLTATILDVEGNPFGVDAK